MITTTAREGGQNEHRDKKKWLRETHSVTYVTRLSTLSDILQIDAQPPPSFLCCPRPASHHPSSPTLVSLVPALCLLLPSTHFWPFYTHPFFPHAQTVSILSDLLYLLTLLRTSSFLTLFICDTPTKYLKYFISRTFTFLLSALLIPLASALYNVVCTITPSYRYFSAFIPNPLWPSTVFSAPHALYPSFCVPHPFNILHQLHLRPQVLKTIHFL